MNRSDSELIDHSMAAEGYVKTNSDQDADIVIFNTCSVRQHAEDRVIARINAIRKEVSSRNGIIVVTGCMAQRIGNILTESEKADLVIGTYQSPSTGRLVNEFLANNKQKSYTSFDTHDFCERLNMSMAEEHDTADWHGWVTITHGCENFCSYCIVPYVRGKLISFPSEKILEYIRILASKGLIEITLLGQNVNQYNINSEDIPFWKLLQKTAEIPGLKRINFLTSHPMDFSHEIVDVIKDHENISRSIHLPLQSGSDTVLKLMNRKYTVAHYMEIVEKIRTELSSYSITTDMIVGFPGETEDNFNETLRRMDEIAFDDAFMYAYSPREGTPSFSFKESLTRDEKIARLNTLIKLQRKIGTEKLESRISTRDKIIVERMSKRSTNELLGKTFLNHPVIIPGTADLIGKMVEIEITGLKGSTLQGRTLA